MSAGFEKYGKKVRAALSDRGKIDPAMPAYMRRDIEQANAAHDALDFLVHAAGSWRAEAEDFEAEVARLRQILDNTIDPDQEEPK